MCFRFGLCARPRTGKVPAASGRAIISNDPTSTKHSQASFVLGPMPLQLTPPAITNGSVLGKDGSCQPGGAALGAVGREEELLQEIERCSAENTELRALLASLQSGSGSTKQSGSKFMYSFAGTGSTQTPSEARTAQLQAASQGLDANAPGARFLRACQSNLYHQKNEQMAPCISLSALRSVASNSNTCTALLLFQYSDASPSNRTSFLDTPRTGASAQVQATKRLPRSASRLSEQINASSAEGVITGGPVVNVQCTWLNQAYLNSLAVDTESAGKEVVDEYITNHLMANRMIESLCRNLVHGRHNMVVHWWEGAVQADGTLGVQRMSLWPCQVALDDGGEYDTGHPALISAAVLCREPTGTCAGPLQGIVQHYMAAAMAPCMITVVDTSGEIQLQNPESCAKLGCHAPSSSTDYSVLLCTPTCDNGDMLRQDSRSASSAVKLNYLTELFVQQEEQALLMQEALAAQQQYEGRIRIASPLLRKWFGLADDEELWYLTQITRGASATGQDVLYITQVEITDVVEAEQQVAALQSQQTALLQEILPSQVINHLMTFKDSSSLPVTPTKRPMRISAEPARVASADLDTSGSAHNARFLDGVAQNMALPSRSTPDLTQNPGGRPPNQLDAVTQVQTSPEPDLPPANLKQALRKQRTEFLYSPLLSRRQETGSTGMDPDASAASEIFTDCLDASCQGLSTMDADDSFVPQGDAPRQAHSTPFEVPTSGPSSIGQHGADEARANTLNPLNLDMLLKAVFPHSTLSVPRMQHPSRSSSQRNIHIRSRRSSVADIAGTSTFVSPQVLTRSTTPTYSMRDAARASGSSLLLDHSHTSCTTSVCLDGSLIHSSKLRTSVLNSPPTSFDQQAEPKQAQQPPQLDRQNEMLPAAMGLHAAPSLDQDSCRVWLTQQDVMSLATYHDQVTILFADIKGFTSMSNQLHPSKVMLFLNRLYSVWDSLLATFGVYKVETIGDSYMASTGLFCTDSATGKQSLGGYDPEHATKMLQFAQAMLLSSQSIETPLGQPVQVRIGIHSGSCSSGVVGQRMPRFCLFGDSVNTASRMESTGRPGCIHASDAFYSLNKQLPWEPTGGVMVKGKGVMDTWLLPVLPTGFVELEQLRAERAAQAAPSPVVTSPTICIQDAPPKAPSCLAQSRSLPVNCDAAHGDASRIQGILDICSGGASQLQAGSLSPSMSATAALQKLNPAATPPPTVQEVEKDVLSKVDHRGHLLTTYGPAASRGQPTWPPMLASGSLWASQPNAGFLLPTCHEGFEGAAGAYATINEGSSCTMYHAAQEAPPETLCNPSGSVTLSNVIIPDARSTVSGSVNTAHITTSASDAGIAGRPDLVGNSSVPLVCDLQESTRQDTPTRFSHCVQQAFSSPQNTVSTRGGLSAENSSLGSQQKDLISHMTSHVLQKLQENRASNADDVHITNCSSFGEFGDGQEPGSARGSRRRASIYSSGNNILPRGRQARNGFRGSLELNHPTVGGFVISGRQSLDRQSKEATGNWWLSVAHQRISYDQPSLGASPTGCHTARPDLEHPGDDVRTLMQQTWPKTLRTFNWV